MNIPYKTTDKLIEALVDEFAPVDKVVIPRDSRNGLARGYAFVYLKDAEHVQKVIDYMDGMHIENRQIRATTTLQGSLQNTEPEDEIHDMATYLNHIRNQLRIAMIAPDRFQDNPGLTHLISLIYSKAQAAGKAPEAIARTIFDQLAEPVNVERLRRTLEATKSLIPEGREADFQNIAFEEQLMSAIADQLSEANMALAQSLNMSSKQTLDLSKYGAILEGLHSRI